MCMCMRETVRVLYLGGGKVVESQGVWPAEGGGDYELGLV